MKTPKGDQSEKELPLLQPRQADADQLLQLKEDVQKLKQNAESGSLAGSDFHRGSYSAYVIVLALIDQALGDTNTR